MAKRPTRSRPKADILRENGDRSSRCHRDDKGTDIPLRGIQSKGPRARTDPGFKLGQRRLITGKSGKHAETAMVTTMDYLLAF